MSIKNTPFPENTPYGVLWIGLGIFMLKNFNITTTKTGLQHTVEPFQHFHIFVFTTIKTITKTHFLLTLKNRKIKNTQLFFDHYFSQSKSNIFTFSHIKNKIKFTTPLYFLSLKKYTKSPTSSFFFKHTENTLFYTYFFTSPTQKYQDIIHSLILIHYICTTIK